MLIDALTVRFKVLSSTLMVAAMASCSSIRPVDVPQGSSMAVNTTGYYPKYTLQLPPVSLTNEYEITFSFSGIPTAQYDILFSCHSQDCERNPVRDLLDRGNLRMTVSLIVNNRDIVRADGIIGKQFIRSEVGEYYYYWNDALKNVYIDSDRQYCMKIVVIYNAQNGADNLHASGLRLTPILRGGGTEGS